MVKELFVNNMESKFKQINIFESSFDSLDFDDGFLMKIDSELKKNKINEKQLNLLNNCKSKGEGTQRGKENKVPDIKANYYDLPLFIEDLNESDFLDFSQNKSKKNLSKIINSHQNQKEKKGFTVGFTSCLSPIQGPIASNNLSVSSSTPLKLKEDLLPKEKLSVSQKTEKFPAKNSEFDYLDADLFDDWDVNENNNKKSPKETVTFSQALKLIEEAESARQSQEFLNQSFDLLTGEVVGTDVGNMFEESFDLSKSVEKKRDEKSTSNSVIVVDESEVKCKPAAAQKLNFDAEKINCLNPTSDKNYNFVGDFNSDDDFDFFTQDLIEKSKRMQKHMKLDSPCFAATKKATDLDMNESTDIISMKKKRGKCFKIIESDGTEDSPSPKFSRKNKIKNSRNFQKFGREFIDSEAEVSDVINVSSDETEEEGEYDKSFVDEESYFSQNCLADMTAEYLESVKTVKRHGSFKIPPAKPYNSKNVFSQIPEENNTDYEIDSFCVPNDMEEEMKTELSDLEVAEKILEMDRKKKKKKRTRKLKKLK